MVSPIILGGTPQKIYIFLRNSKTNEPKDSVFTSITRDTFGWANMKFQRSTMARADFRPAGVRLRVREIKGFLKIDGARSSVKRKRLNIERVR